MHGILQINMQVYMYKQTTYGGVQVIKKYLSQL